MMLNVNEAHSHCYLALFNYNRLLFLYGLLLSVPYLIEAKQIGYLKLVNQQDEVNKWQTKNYLLKSEFFLSYKG